jgi:very-short-patch-repair endonuclease
LQPFDGNGFRPDFLDPARRLDHDRRRDQLLTVAGWRVIRFTSRQVVYEREHVAATLRALFEF